MKDIITARMNSLYSLQTGNQSLKNNTEQLLPSFYLEVASGIRTPMAHRLIMEDERKGIIYDRIVGEALSIKFNESSELVYDKWMDKFVDFHKQLMQHNIDDVMSYKDFLKMFATNEETIAKINALWYCRICLE